MGLLNDLRGKCILITGGTMGIGLATGLAFARQGARVTLTHKWGSADDDDVRSHFIQEGLEPPQIVAADASRDEDTEELLKKLRFDFDAVEVFVSNVSMALVVKSLDDYSKRSLFKSIEYSAWPFFEYTRRIRDVFGRYPRYVIGLSSGGPDHFHANYDFVAASKALMEVLCRYMNYRLFGEDVRLNVVRARAVRTESLRATFGPDFEEFLDRANMARDFIAAEEVAQAILALCSGLMDGVSGQVLMIDRGGTFRDTLMRLYNEREHLKFSLNGFESKGGVGEPADQPSRR
jgi:NAD(P)-dependent dehydrogenase (short-subunit alcohol dehydrogenase family)